MNIGIAGRISAACIAAIAAVGLLVQFAVSYQQQRSVLVTLWILLAYFTITTNVIVTVVFIGIVIKGARFYSAQLVAGTMLSIVLVGVIYNLLLHGLSELSGGSQVANAIMHVVTPILVPLFWAFFVPKGKLKWQHPFLWAVYPLLYLIYALMRGNATGQYAYPFMNVLRLGWKQTLFNSDVIAVAFLLAALAVVWIDHWIGSRPKPLPDQAP